MSNEDADAHFRWIGIIADRIICAKDPGKQLPLLSLSFLGDHDNIPNFSQFKRPNFPITVDDLADGKLYGIILYVLSSNKKTKSNPNLAKVYELLNEDQAKRSNLTVTEKEIDNSFDSILNNLSNKGYRPKKPCDPSGLNDKNIEHHVNLCKSIEFYIVDHSLRADLLISDLRRLPRSFFVFQRNMHIDHIEDAVSLWLSKFHCNPFFTKEAKIGNSKYENDSQKLIKQYKLHLNEKNYCLQIDTSKYSKVAACLARIFPKQIDKNEIKDGISEEEIQFNKSLSNSILSELHAFMIDEYPCDERLFLLFISDLFYATREGAKNFVKAEISRQVSYVPRHQPLTIHNYQIARPQALSVCTFTKKPIINDIKSSQNNHNFHINHVELFKPNLNNRAKTQPKIVRPAIEQTPLPPLKADIKPPNKDKSLDNNNNHDKNHDKKHVKNHKKAQNKKRKTKNSEQAENADDQEQIEEDQNDQEEEEQVDNSQQVVSDAEVNQNSQEKKRNDTEKKKIKKYNLEFPEIEILLKRLIDKYPDEEDYFIDLYDSFMRIMQEAYAVNSPKVSDIFKRAQSTFQLLLEGQKIDYDFEYMLSSMIKKQK